MTDLANKVVWITGASSGIGEALAQLAGPARRAPGAVLAARSRTRTRAPAPAHARRTSRCCRWTCPHLADADALGRAGRRVLRPRRRAGQQRRHLPAHLDARHRHAGVPAADGDRPVRTDRAHQGAGAAAGWSAAAGMWSWSARCSAISPWRGAPVMQRPSTRCTASSTARGSSWATAACDSRSPAPASCAPTSRSTRWARAACRTASPITTSTRAWSRWSAPRRSGARWNADRLEVTIAGVERIAVWFKRYLPLRWYTAFARRFEGQLIGRSRQRKGARGPLLVSMPCE